MDPELKASRQCCSTSFTEYSLDNDLALALTLDAAGALREGPAPGRNVRVHVERFRRLAWRSSEMSSEGKSFPRWRFSMSDGTQPAASSRRWPVRIRAALGTTKVRYMGPSLPGVAEIERAAEAPRPLPTDRETLLQAGSTRRAATQGRSCRNAARKRKLVLATSIAERPASPRRMCASSSTAGSRAARGPIVARGSPRLVTERASRAAVTQRAGRAARQAAASPSTCGRKRRQLPCPPTTRRRSSKQTWPSLLPQVCFKEPNLAERLRPPSTAPRRRPMRRGGDWKSLGAIDEEGAESRHMDAPSPPRPSNRDLRICFSMQGSPARGRRCRSRRPTDRTRLRGGMTWIGGQRRRLAPRQVAAAAAATQSRRAMEAASQGADDAAPAEHDFGKALALAFPDRLSRRRESSGESWQSVGGRGFRLDPASSLARSQWIAVGEVAGHASGARVLSAAAIDEAAVLELFGDRVEVRHDGQFDAVTASVTPTRSRRLGGHPSRFRSDPSPDQSDRASTDRGRSRPWAALAAVGRTRPSTPAPRRFRKPVRCLYSCLDEEMLSGRIEEWLSPLLIGKRRLGDISGQALAGGLEQLLGYEGRRALDRLAPSQFVSPAGSQHAIDYSSDAGPTVEVRAQALFGLGKHPTVANGRAALILAITSPRWTADPDDEGSAGILARDLARRREGHARALPQTSVARRPGIGIAHTAEQALKRFDEAEVNSR